MIVLQSSPLEASYRHAWVSRQAATSLAEKEEAFFQLESVLKRAPFHLAALQSHLDLALELDRAPAAIRSAERLYSIDRRNVTTLQMCAEVVMRYPTEQFVLPSISKESLSELVQKFGPVPQWRDSLVIEFANYCCHHPDSVDSQLTSAVGAAITTAADHIGSAKAHFESWHFARIFGEEDASLDSARRRIDDECPRNVAYEIYLASAKDAWLGDKPDDAKSFLTKAIDMKQNDYRCYELLGDVYQAQQESSQCTVAYLRAWRLAGDHPLELGIKLAESLAHGERYSALPPLVKTLENEVRKSAITPDRTLRIRLQLVYARLAMRQARHEDALQKLERCHMLATRNCSHSDELDEWVPAIETLQAQCLVRLGKYADTARLFENRASKIDSPAYQWRAAARAWRTDGNAFAAARCYRNAVFKQGGYSEIWLEYVSFLKDTRGIDEAAREVTFRHRRAQQGAAIADQVLAQAWEMVGRPGLAIQHYRLAAQHEAKDVAALAIALARQGQVHDALELIADDSWSVSAPIRAHTAAIVGANAANLSTASKATIMQIVQDGTTAASDDATLLMAAVQWYTRCQSTSDAMELLKRVVALQPENVIAANNLAMMLADEGCEFERAIECIDNALKQTGPVAEFLDTKGWILVQMNRSEEAIPWLIKAVEQSSSQDPITHLHLAAAYMDHGDRVHAREYLAAARAAPILPELLNTSEQRAWATLQKEFTQLASARADGVAW
ncbi:tetratricopeptide repeat protein [Aporhodopirellula aestuarii]|uniref:tetratricopeptide repeat protein n=1 Tax=Aporhodopirellula aestuarii TaxID=2950107 RepID=UPI002034122B|nr:tetratricopeptide repeat protein [Aporhodopirellula aestuarii]